MITYNDAKSKKISMIHRTIFKNNPYYQKVKKMIQQELFPFSASAENVIISEWPFEEPLLTPAIWRAMTTMLGMVIGDALGAPFEFNDFRELGYAEKGKQINMSPNGITGYTEVKVRFGLQPGQWTDDTSMGLVLADNLLENGRLHCGKLMQEFCDWWDHGYNNAFAEGAHNFGQNSIGLGGNIAAALENFRRESLHDKIKMINNENYATQAGDETFSGNGSIMRNAAPSIFALSLEEAMNIAYKQSMTTHQGIDAAGCAQLMAAIIYRAIHDVFSWHRELNAEKRKRHALDSQFLEEIIKTAKKMGREFSPTVKALARSTMEKKENGKIRNWNWRMNFKFQEDNNLDYVGSYSVDGLAMALHCVESTNSFRDAILKAATRGGDADSVGAITGQIAGAIYGIEQVPVSWIRAVQQWDRGGEIIARGYLLYYSQRR